MHTTCDSLINYKMQANYPQHTLVKYICTFIRYFVIDSAVGVKEN